MNKPQIVRWSDIRSLRQASSSTIAVIGDLMIDIRIDAKSTRRSPEAPVLVVEPEAEHESLGGAAHVAKIFADLGAKVLLCGLAGDDREARRFSQLADVEENIEFFPWTVAGARTTIKTRYFVEEQQVFRVDRDNKVQPSDNQSVAAMEAFIKVCVHQGVSALVLSDYAKGTFTRAGLRRVIDIAKKAAIPIFVDPKNPIDWFEGATQIKLNARECGWETAGFVNRLDTGELDIFGFDAVVVTAAAGGSAFRKSGKTFSAPSLVSSVTDVSGAGDAFLAGMVVGYLANMSEDLTLLLASHFAKRACEVIGIANPNHAVFDFIRRVERVLVFESEFVETYAHFAQQAGQTIVFTNGVFDILHAGHLALLREASKFGDVLIVAINSDASVRRLKGKSRPILGEGERSSALLELEMVDLVVVFQQENPAEVIVSASPDVLVKGGDYERQEVVGSDFVVSRGGKVVLVPLVGGVSTTEILRRADSSRKSSV